MSPRAWLLLGAVGVLGGWWWRERLQELSRTSTGLPNAPPAATWPALFRLHTVLRQLPRAQLQSAYRSHAVERAVYARDWPGRSVPAHSLHEDGLAADLSPAPGVSWEELAADVRALRDAGVFVTHHDEGNHLHVEIAA